MTQLLSVGVIGKSSKENEKRVPIHPEHINGIPRRLREQITFEEGYGVRFGMNDNTLARLTSGRVAFREEILNGFDCVLLPSRWQKIYLRFERVQLCGVGRIVYSRKKLRKYQLKEN